MLYKTPSPSMDLWIKQLAHNRLSPWLTSSVWLSHLYVSTLHGHEIERCSAHGRLPSPAKCKLNMQSTQAKAAFQVEIQKLLHFLTSSFFGHQRWWAKSKAETISFLHEVSVFHMLLDWQAKDNWQSKATECPSLQVPSPLMARPVPDLPGQGPAIGPRWTGEIDWLKFMVWLYLWWCVIQ